jgi:dihydrofolate synthase / folylpolyglutamate synthase
VNWTAEDAERHLLSLELFGMRFGLDRMRRLTNALGLPQQRYASVHVVGSNGKSSTVRMTAAILERHGRRTGAYLSPHLRSFCERIRVDSEDIEPEAFGAAVQRAAHAAELVNRTLADGDRVTQFELLTAAAFDELARRDIDVAVIEAGLGGRYDATNVIPSSVQVLTTVGLEHTRWLGPTVRDIAREKLAVVQDGGTLVLGDVPPEALEEAEEAVERHGANLVRPGAGEDVELGSPSPFQRRNFALARAAAEALIGPLDEAAVRAAALDVSVPGRMEFVDVKPLTILDGAHNPSGMQALAEALAELTTSRLVGVVSILDDKDAADMLRALLPLCDAVVFTKNANPRALSPATLSSLASQVSDGVETSVEADPHRALAKARELAGEAGLVVATGSIYLVADLVNPPGARRASML